MMKLSRLNWWLEQNTREITKIAHPSDFIVDNRICVVWTAQGDGENPSSQTNGPIV